MRRYLSLSRSQRNSYVGELASEKNTIAEEADSGAHNHGETSTIADEVGSTAALMSPTTPLAPPNLKVKRLDYYWSGWSKSWKYKNMGAKVTPEGNGLIGGSGSGSDAWAQYCFVVVRKLPRNQDEGEPTFQITIKSPYLRDACKHVIQKVPGVSWNADPLELDPHLLLAFLPNFEAYQAEVKGKRHHSAEESNTLTTISVLIDYLYKDYRGTIATIRNLTSHGEITFNLLYSVMIPRSILITECPVTGEPRALQLVSATKILTMTGGFYDLLCESVDAADPVYTDPWGTANSAEQEVSKAGAGKAFGRVQNRVIIPSFKGTVKINSLDAFPLKYHARENEIREQLLARGKKWVGLKGIHHLQYKGSASLTLTSNNGQKKVIRYNVNSRVMVDRSNFKRLNPNYELPVIKVEQDGQQQQQDDSYDPYNQNNLRRLPPPDPNRGIPTLRVQTVDNDESTELTDEELLLTSPIVYGFSLSDKIWLEFNVEIIRPIVWNDEAFRSLVLPGSRKDLLQSLVEAHNADLGFDDFIQGKGAGLVINLFGPPGVGKTLSAEATSEHVRRPLYVIGGGDLGTTAAELDEALQRVFDIATSWKAIVLIDEADVFLEQRSLHDLERNAMVAVFLRHVEYYRGILFMTTNRVKTFDEAFLSRIHVALHFQELTPEAKEQVWRAFLAKANVEIGEEDGQLSAESLGLLAARDINGRQIKNATRTANSLAISRGEKLSYVHLEETLDAMDEFTSQFKNMNREKMSEVEKPTSVEPEERQSSKEPEQKEKENETENEKEKEKEKEEGRGKKGKRDRN